MTSATSIFPVGDVEFVCSDLDAATSEVISLARSQTPLSVRLANAYCVVLAASDPAYQRVLNGPGLTFPDGTPVSLVMRLKHRFTRNLANRAESAPRRVRGPSLFRSILARSQGTGLRHFFLGTNDDTLRKLVVNITAEWPGLEVAGTYAPPYAPFSNELVNECTAALALSRADIVWVALGTPKQDFLAKAITDRMAITTVAVGAAFDFVAGTTAEAPRIFQTAGIEWAFRLLSEPRRLWRRYLIGNLRFISLVLRRDFRMRKR